MLYKVQEELEKGAESSTLVLLVELVVVAWIAAADGREDGGEKTLLTADWPCPIVVIWQRQGNRQGTMRVQKYAKVL